MKFCINCGRQIADDSPFCRFCGAKQPIKSIQPSQPTNLDNRQSPIQYQNNIVPKPNVRPHNLSQTLPSQINYPKATSNNLIMSTTGQIPNHNYRVISTVSGIAIQLNNNLRDSSKNSKDKNKSKDYTKKLNHIKELAIKRMKSQAFKIGANAIITIRLNASSINKNIWFIIAYGTAIRFI